MCIRLLSCGNGFFYGGCQDIYRHLVVSALRNYDICISLAGFNELEIHRFYSLGVAFYYRLHCLPPFYYVPCHHPHQSVIIIGIDEYLDVHLIPEFLASEYEYAFDYYHFGRLDSYCLGPGPGTGDIGIDRFFNAFTGAEHRQMPVEQIKVD